MQEDFIPFEIAKKLRDKEFDEYSEWSYNKIGSFHDTEIYREINSFYCYAPTIPQVLKWLRENKRVYIVVEPFPSMARKDNVCWSWSFKWNSTGVNIDHTFPDDLTYSTFEQAALAGIEYALDNLI